MRPGTEGILNLISDVLIFGAGIGAFTFALSYVTFFNWRKTAPGRALLYFVVSLILLCIVNALGRWVGPDYPLREWVRISVYVTIALTVWRLVWVLWRSWLADQPLLSVEQKPKKEKPE